MIKLYTLLDKASSTTNHPMPFSTQRDAIDGLRSVANDEKTSINKHPEDFELYELGSYNPREMKFDLFDQPKLVIPVTELLN